MVKISHFLTEWCSSCKSTRSVRLALPEEETDTALEEEEELVGATVEKVFSAPTSQNACTQTPKPKPRRRSGDDCHVIVNNVDRDQQPLR